jgi:hypothetical protein
MPPMPPKAPVLPKVSPRTAVGSVTLAWNPSSGSGITNYNLYYGVISGVYTNQTPVGNVTNATIGLPARGVRYYFAATAVNDQGLESVYSAEINWLDPLPPPPPTNWLVSVTVQQSLDNTNWLDLTNLAALTFTNPPTAPALYWRARMNITPQ